MWKTILRRVLVMIPQIIILSILIFFLAKMMPGDPFTGLIDPKSDPATIARLRQEYGLNDAPWVQYLNWVKNLFHGDLGMSYTQHMSVTSLIGDRAQNTFWLALTTIILSYLFAIPMGIIAGRYKDKWPDQTIRIFNYITFAIPGFVAYVLALWLFGYLLNWFPTTGTISVSVAPGFLNYLLDRAHHIILPAVVAALISTTSTVQYLRTGIIDNQVEDYVRTARSKGVPERVVFNKHILRNSLLPITAFIGNIIGALLGGSVMLETVFSYPGMGKLFMESIGQRDYPVLTALILLFGILAILGNLISDIVMTIVDPRIRVK
ncbi:ABC transporter permease [Holzapfeliella sp. He02]|uniref:ABC transporter permease n=1 Tax=Holzapfeliella saturejae TaxID=3082953 RepID=A0ABU8SGQ6_9LACO